MQIQLSKVSSEPVNMFKHPICTFQRARRVLTIGTFSKRDQRASMGRFGAKRHKTGPCKEEAKPVAITVPPDCLHVDGSILEGGGQILRNAAALAAITGQSVHITKIRAGRSQPGLRPQHLTGLQLVRDLCSGQLQGVQVKATEVVLQPGPLVAGMHEVDTRTAGSCMLLAQSALPCLLMSAPRNNADGEAGQSVLELKGGTDADMAPPVSYIQQVLVPMLKRLLGVDIDLELKRRGFFPKGGGHVVLQAKALPAGSALPAFELMERGSITCMHFHAHTAGRVPPVVAERMLATAKAEVKKGLKPAVKIETTSYHAAEAEAVGDGTGLLLVATTDKACVIGAAGIGEKGKPAEQVASEAAAAFVEAVQSGAPVDQWLQDQLIIFMALADGTSRMRCTEPTLHTRTAMVTAEKLLPAAKFTVTGPTADDTMWTVQCSGAAVKAGHKRRQQSSG